MTVIFQNVITPWL